MYYNVRAPAAPTPPPAVLSALRAALLFNAFFLMFSIVIIASTCTRRFLTRFVRASMLSGDRVDVQHGQRLPTGLLVQDGGKLEPGLRGALPADLGADPAALPALGLDVPDLPVYRHGRLRLPRRGVQREGPREGRVPERGFLARAHLARARRRFLHLQHEPVRRAGRRAADAAWRLPGGRRGGGSGGGARERVAGGGAGEVQAEEQAGEAREVHAAESGGGDHRAEEFESKAVKDLLKERKGMKELESGDQRGATAYHQ